MFEQPEALCMDCTEFKGYPERPSFNGHTVLDGATKGECKHLNSCTPVGLADRYICIYVHVHVACVSCMCTCICTCGVLSVAVCAQAIFLYSCCTMPFAEYL